jgi:NAD(P)-dependent dehydrogenase (short-subunit alcohol dehydrogenase family)
MRSLYVQVTIFICVGSFLISPFGRRFASAGIVKYDVRRKSVLHLLIANLKKYKMNTGEETMQDPVTKFPAAPQPAQQQAPPGTTNDMNPQPDHGEETYRGSGKLLGKKAIITGGDSGIGRAVAIAFAKEGADVLIAYLNEDADAQDTAMHVIEAGRQALLVAGDIGEEAHCKKIVEQAVAEFGQIDILVNNAAFQMTRESLQEIPSEEWDKTFRTNIHAMFYLCKAAEPHMKPGAAIINTTSVNAYTPRPTLLAYAATKGAIQNFTANLAQLLGEKGIRVNCVAPGPVWTPLIPSTMPQEQVEKFGQDGPLKRPAQPVELSPVYVLLASDEASYISGATVPVTGGKPTI